MKVKVRVRSVQVSITHVPQYALQHLVDRLNTEKQARAAVRTLTRNLSTYNVQKYCHLIHHQKAGRGLETRPQVHARESVVFGLSQWRKLKWP